jgi:hypothetical protein
MTSQTSDSPSREFPYRQGNPWLGVDRREDYEEYIAGNRAGLEALRDAVTQALDNGKSEIKIQFTDYPGIVLVEGDPRETEQGKPKAIEWIAGIVSILLVPTLFIAGTALVVVLSKWLWKLIFEK